MPKSLEFRRVLFRSSLEKSNCFERLDCRRHRAAKSNALVCLPLVWSGSRALQFAGVPLSVGDLVAGNAAHDFLTSVNHATVLGTIAQRQCNVVRPFIGLVVPWRALMGRSGSGARDQAPIDGNAGYRVAIIRSEERRVGKDART